MESFLDYFAHLSSAQRTLWLAGGLVLFWILEGLLPLQRFAFDRWQHAARNLVLTALQLLVGFSLAVLLVRTAAYTSENRFGLLYLADLPTWLHALLGLLLLDLVGAYLIHWLEHRIPLLWRFHLVHHTDQQVDVTTGLRHHPIEAVFRMLFTALGILLAGVPLGMVFLYQSLSIFFAHLSHANFRTPPGLDRGLSYVFVTPRFHRVHHHFRQPLTDSNYGNIFSIWDRLFGTFRFRPVDELRFGIDSHLDPAASDRLGRLLSIPFAAYRRPPGAKFSEESK